MPTYGSERAVILPQLQNASEPGWRAIENIQQNERVAEEKRRYEQHRQDQMLGWALEKMDYSKVATGTIYDPSIHQTLSELQKSVADDITNGRYANNAEMMMKVASGVADVAAYSNAVKQQRAMIEQDLQQYEKDPSIDMNKLRKAAFDKAFWKFDEGGRVSIRRPNEFENRSYVQDVLDTTPENVITGTQSLYESLPKQNFQEVKDKYKRRDSKGHYIDDSYSAKVYDFQEVWFDEKDNGRAKLRTKQNAVTLSDGSKINGLTDDVYERMFGNDRNRRILNAEYNKLYKGKDSGLNDDDKEKIKKGIALGLVNASKVGKIENSDADLQKMPSYRTYNTINMPGGGVAVNDVFSYIKGEAEKKKNDGNRYLQVNLLRADAQEHIVKTANAIGTQLIKEKDGKESRVPYTQKDLKVLMDDNGVGVYNAHTGKLITFLDPVGTNISAQPSVKEKREVVKQGKQQPAKQPKKSTNNDPLGLGL